MGKEGERKDWGFLTTTDREMRTAPVTTGAAVGAEDEHRTRGQHNGDNFTGPRPKTHCQAAQDKHWKIKRGSRSSSLGTKDTDLPSSSEWLPGTKRWRVMG